MENIYLIKLIRMINNVNKMNDSDNRIDRINKIYSYGLFCYYAKHISLRDYVIVFNMIKNNPREKQIKLAEKHDFNILLNNNDLLSNFYKKYLSLYEILFSGDNDNKDYCTSNINTYKLFVEFMKYMDCYDLYSDLVDKKKICFNSRLGYSSSINDGYDTYILCSEKDIFNRYYSLSHEMGHAFENRIMCNEEDYFSNVYMREIISILFQRLFKEFIIQNSCLSNEDINKINVSFEIFNYNKILLASFITDVISEGEYNVFDYAIYKSYSWGKIGCDLNAHNYAIGGIVSLNLINEWRKNEKYFISNLRDLVQNIYNTNLSELVNQYDNEEIIKEEIKRLVK